MALAHFLHPAHLPVPDEGIVGAATVHALFLRWRDALTAGAHATQRPLAAVASADE